MEKNKKKNIQTEDPEKEKKEYVSPALQTTYVQMEYSFAAGSATLNPGDVGSLNTPQVEDWNDGGDLGNKDFDL